MQQLLHDLRHALRIFRESPVFAATVVAALTLGIGVNVAIFSVVDTVLLKPLPLPNPQTLVWPENTRNGVPRGVSASPATFLFWRAQTDIFRDVGAFRDRLMNYTGGDIPQQLTAQQVSEGFFRVYGGRIIRGRPFTRQEDSPGGGKVAVISYRFWQQHFGGAADVLGKTLPLNGDRYTIIGVTGPKFDLRDFGSDPDLWVPLQLDPNSTSQIGYFGAGARLKPGVTLAQAKARLKASAAAFKKKYPGVLG